MIAKSQCIVEAIARNSQSKLWMIELIKRNGFFTQGNCLKPRAYILWSMNNKKGDAAIGAYEEVALLETLLDLGASMKKKNASVYRKVLDTGQQG